MKRILAIFLAFIAVTALCSGLTACKSETIYSEGKGEINVLCTTFALFDFVREIGGDRVTVSILQDSGADLHNYTPTAATLEAISRADLFIYVGGTSDLAWINDAIRAAGNSKLTTLCLMDSVTPIFAELENDWSSTEHAHGHEDEHHKHEGHDHGADEHIWTSVKNAISMVSSIKDALCQIDSNGASLYEERASAYTERLCELDRELEYATDSIEIALFADRFPFVYLMHDYHVPYIAAFSGCSTEVNAGFEIQIKLIETVRSKDIEKIFVIEGGSKDLAEAIARETGCKIVVLNSLQSVDRAAIESGITYLDVMYSNILAIKGGQS